MNRVWVTNVSGSTKSSNCDRPASVGLRRRPSRRRVAVRPGAIGADAELAAEHDVEGMRLGTAGFVAELQTDDAALLAGLLFVFVGHEPGKAAVQIHLRHGNVSVFVAGNIFQERRRQIFGEAFGDRRSRRSCLPSFSSRTRMVLTIRLITSSTFIMVRLTVLPVCFVDVLFSILVGAVDVFDADHEAGFAGDGCAVGQPAGAAAHRFGEVVGAEASASCSRLRISVASMSTAVK